MPQLTDQILYDKLCQVMRVGFVNARMPEKMRVKVTLKDMPGGALVTDWLPVLTPRASQDMQYDLPDIGDQVLCFFLPYGHEQGFVAGAMYGKQTPPVQNGEKWHRTFKDGAYLEYDRANHALKADIPGTAELKCANSITLEAPIIYLRGTLVNTAKDGSPGVANFSGGMTIQNGGLNVTSGDVVASGVSLVSHTTDGVEAGNDTSKHPTGGSSESPGTAAMAIPAIGTAAYAAMAATKMLELEEHTNELGNDTFKLIACLPKICVALASEEKKKGNTDLEDAYHELGELIEHWLIGMPNDDAMKGGEPVFLKWENLIKFPRFSIAYNTFTANPPIKDKRNIFNEAAKISLQEYLCRHGFMEKGKTTEFDFIGTKSNWQKWENDYHSSYPAPANYQINMDYTMIVLGGFSLRALAKGKVQWLEGNTYMIHVEKIAVILWDSFNFHNDNNFKDILAQMIFGVGFWRCEPPAMERYLFPGSAKLVNGDFQLFRLVNNCGNDFMVLTEPHIVESFNGDSYKYACPNQK